MKRYLPLILCIAMLMTGCHTGKRVVRGDMGTVVEGSDKGKKPSAKPVEVPQTNKYKDKATRALISEAIDWIGTPYLYGGDTKDGVDCSGLVMQVYKQALDISLPRSSAKIAEFCPQIDKGDLRPGDLLFFHTGSDPEKVTHVGIYIGDGQMIHSSSSKGVVISDIEGKYYVDRYHQCGKVPQYHKLLK